MIGFIIAVVVSIIIFKYWKELKKEQFVTNNPRSVEYQTNVRGIEVPGSPGFYLLNNRSIDGMQPYNPYGRGINPADGAGLGPSLGAAVCYFDPYCAAFGIRTRKDGTKDIRYFTKDQRAKFNSQATPVLGFNFYTKISSFNELEKAGLIQ